MENSRYNNEVFDLQIHPETKQTLKTTCTWARIVAIVAMASAALTIIDIILTITGVATAPGKEAGLAVQLFSAIIGVALAFFLLKFSQHGMAGVDGNNQAELNLGLSNLRTYFKIYGVLLIIALCLVVVMVIFGVMLAAKNI